jgi:hypothetical protein
MSYLILGAILLGLVILAVPVSLGYDSGEKWFKVRWLGLTMTNRLGVEKPKKLNKTVTQKRQISTWPLMRRLWRQRDLCLKLIHQVRRFGLEVIRTLKFRDTEAALSLPDPMWNGLLYAVVTNIDLKNVDLSVNFENRNFAKIWVTVYPYRVAGKLAVLLLRLPYLRIIRFAWDLKKITRY